MQKDTQALEMIIIQTGAMRSSMETNAEVFLFYLLFCTHMLLDLVFFLKFTFCSSYPIFGVNFVWYFDPNNSS